MRYVAAYLLATLGGNNNPSKEDIVKILSSVGLEVEDDKLERVSKMHFLAVEGIYWRFIPVTDGVAVFGMSLSLGCYLEFPGQCGRHFVP